MGGGGGGDGGGGGAAGGGGGRGVGKEIWLGVELFCSQMDWLFVPEKVPQYRWKLFKCKQKLITVFHK